MVRRPGKNSIRQGGGQRDARSQYFDQHRIAGPKQLDQVPATQSHGGEPGRFFLAQVNIFNHSGFLSGKMTQRNKVLPARTGCMLGNHSNNNL
jgi:hypothetical protein